MYPTLADFLRDIFGDSLPLGLFKFLHVFNSFGILMALSFIAAAYVLKKELARMLQAKQVDPITREIVENEPATTVGYIRNSIAGALLGFKLGLFFTEYNRTTADVQAAFFSKRGSILFLIIGAAIAAFAYYWENRNNKTAVKKNIVLSAGDMVGEIVIRAALGGIIGAKLFHCLEYWDDFIHDPIGLLFSGSGLTFYGGLIMGAAAVVYWAIKNKVSPRRLADAIAPGLMLAYALGRVGCMLAGDGDWGIYNSAYITNGDGSVQVADSATFEQHVNNNAHYFYRQYESFDKIPQASVKAPAFLPDWMFAFSFPHNVISEGVLMENCSGEHCAALPVPAFPTPFYETMICLLFFVILMFLRNKTKVAGMIIAIYMILNGIERFAIEQIRVNSTYSIFGFHPTQAELISLFLIIVGAVWYGYLAKKGNTITTNESN
jgi:prolipoprotein diacylglyceryltransferase